MTTIDTRTEAERRYDALRDGSFYQLAPAQPPTMRETIEAVWEEGEQPSGDQIYDLINEDRIARYAWMRAIDWVLYRLACGLPVQPLSDSAQVSAAIDAQFTAAVARARDMFAPCSVYEQLNGDMLSRWERATPPPPAAPRPIQTKNWYHDGDDDGDLTTEEKGPLAWTDYIIGKLEPDGKGGYDRDDDRVYVSFSMDGAYEPQASLCGEEAQPLAVVARAVINFQRLLADPRVQAMRVRYEAGAPLKKAA